MLQINTGKLFTKETEYTNHLKGVLYTNFRFYGKNPIDTVVGKLVPTSNIRDSFAVIYEMTEKIEYQGKSPGILISHGIDPYLLDFSTVVSFRLNCICTPDYDLVVRLTSAKQGPAAYASPEKIVSRTFDNKITFKEENEEQLSSFIKQLIGLERKYFLGVMRAIRTYVTGIHRIADDLELAYTLLVASIESLAQDFDGYESTWKDYPTDKKKIIDKALNDCNEETVIKIREALLSIEHTSLSRRFRKFVTKHIKNSYFREEAVSALNPLGRSDLENVLKQAYSARSKYIHNLKKLPDKLTYGDSFSETVTVEGKRWLTLQGLSRLARHVIIEFVERQSTVESEIYDYQLERAGITQGTLAPELWIHNVKNIKAEHGNSRLQGFLENLVQIEQGNKDSLVDMREVLKKIEPQLPSMKQQYRRSFVVLHILFNNLVSESDRMDSGDFISQKYSYEFSEPSSESLILNLLLGLEPNWKLLEHYNAIINYFKNRDHKYELSVPKIYEVGMVLDLSERYRKNGEHDKVQELIAFAVENYPGHHKLLDLESTYEQEIIIDWKSIF